MSQNGKGSKPRPKSVSYDIWSKNFDKIFKHGKKNKTQTKDK